MAYTIKITGYSKTDDKALVEMEPDWWDADELMQDNRFTEKIRARGYRGFDADLSISEMRDLHEHYKKNVTTIQKWLCFKFKRLSRPCRKMQEALFDRSGRYARFHVRISEWDSGL